MSWLVKLVKILFSRKEIEKDADRYIPGGMDEHFSKDLEQPSKMFRRAFGDHYHDEE